MFIRRVTNLAHKSTHLHPKMLKPSTLSTLLTTSSKRQFSSSSRSITTNNSLMIRPTSSSSSSSSPSSSSLLFASTTPLISSAILMPTTQQHGIITRAIMTTRSNHSHSFQLPSSKASNLKAITLDDLLPLEKYLEIRDQINPIRIKERQLRLVQIGRKISVSFENYDSIWFQIQEMLKIEQGGDEQALEEIEAYEKLIPQGDNLVINLYIEENHRERRDKLLRSLVGIDERVELSFGNHKIVGRDVDEGTIERNLGGKTSAVHFLSFDMNKEQKEAFQEAKEATLNINHDEYPHSTRITGDLMHSLQQDLK